MATALPYPTLNSRHLAKVECEAASQRVTYFLHTDQIGSIRAITDSAGQVVARFEYEPFGLLSMSTGSAASDAHRFTGKAQDSGTGLYYFGARYYDPQAGRFISRDPASQGLNWHVYCFNNPQRYIDADGRLTCAAGGNVMAAFLLKIGLTGQVVIDGYGNVGLLVAADIGGGTPNAAAACALTCTGADTIFDLRGIGSAAGGSAGPIGLEVSCSDQCTGVTITYGVSVFPAGGYGTVGGCLVLEATGWVRRFIESLIIPWMSEQMRCLPDPVKRVIMDEVGISPGASGETGSGSQDCKRPINIPPAGVTYCTTKYCGTIL